MSAPLPIAEAFTAALWNRFDYVPRCFVAGGHALITDGRIALTVPAAESTTCNSLRAETGRDVAFVTQYTDAPGVEWSNVDLHNVAVRLVAADSEHVLVFGRPYGRALFTALVATLLNAGHVAVGLALREDGPLLVRAGTATLALMCAPGATLTSARVASRLPGEVMS